MASELLTHLGQGSLLENAGPEGSEVLQPVPAVMAMAMSYNWLFLWDNKHSINGVSSVLITGKWP